LKVIKKISHQKLAKASQFLGEKVGHESVCSHSKNTFVFHKKTSKCRRVFTKIRAHEAAMASLLLDEKICFIIRLPPDTLQNFWQVI
jgi:hypothetical protein